MAGEVEATLRTSESYELGRRALEMMQAASVWPTPINYELWIHCAADPRCPLAKELERLVGAGEPITDDVSEQLAAAYLPSRKAQEQIRDAGDALSKQLESVGKAVAAAQRSSVAYGETLGAASRNLSAEQDADALKRVVDGLSDATRKVHEQNRTLEKRLADSAQEMTRLRQHLEDVRRDSMTDALTTLANRKAFDEALDKACAQADATGRPVALALVDIDYFKRFNDTWGHQTGDQVLRYVASVLGRAAEPPAVAARYGGEEFAMIIPDADPMRVEALLEQLRLEIGGRTLKRRATNEDLGAVTVSAGWAMRTLREGVRDLTERADQALYASKRGGRNRVTSAGPGAVKAAA